MSRHDQDAKLPAGSRYCLCRECDRYFKSPSAFEQHRLGDMGARRCATDAELADMGLSRSRLGYWRVEGTGWHSDMGTPAKAAISLDVQGAVLAGR